MTRINQYNIKALGSALKECSDKVIDIGGINISKSNLDFLSDLILSGDRYPQKNTYFVGIVNNKGYIKPYSIFQGSSLPECKNIYENSKLWIKRAVEDNAVAIYFGNYYVPSHIVPAIIEASNHGLKTLFTPLQQTPYKNSTRNIIVAETIKKRFFSYIVQQEFNKEFEKTNNSKKTRLPLFGIKTPSTFGSDLNCKFIPLFVKNYDP
jgi:hypothetical protein